MQNQGCYVLPSTSSCSQQRPEEVVLQKQNVLPLIETTCQFYILPLCGINKQDTPYQLEELVFSFFL